MLEQRVSLQQKQNLVLSQKLMQSFKMLSMPAVDLRSEIYNKIEKNPALEIVFDPLDKKHKAKVTENYKTLSSYLNERKQYFGESGNQASDKYQKFLESIPDKGESLYSHLIEQLSFSNLPNNIFNFAEMVVYNLDQNGFNIVPIDELFENYNAYNSNDKITEDDLKQIITLIQKLDPIGCAVDNFFDSLSIQAEILFQKQIKYDICYDYAIDLLKNHHECFKTQSTSGFYRSIKKISKDYNSLSLEDASYILELISTLNPRPGLQFSNLSSENKYIIPEIIVKKNETGFSAIVNNEQIPVLRVSKFLEKALENSESKKNQSELQECVRNANDFINSLNFRKETILKLASAIIIYQYDFFRKGPKYLTPLKQQDIADELKLNNSTISRCANGKYLQCDWGIFEIKYFFSNSVVSNNQTSLTSQHAKNHSKNAVKEVLKDIIQNSSKKLSDQKLVEELLKKDIKISRRTVNKYRNELGIDVSYNRN